MLPVIWIGFAVVTALAAQARGRSFIGWLVIGCLTGVFGLLAVLVMRNLATHPIAQPDHHTTNTYRIAEDPTPSNQVKAFYGVPILKHEQGYEAMGKIHATVIDAENYIKERFS